MGFRTITDRLLNSLAEKLDTQQTSLSALESTETLAKTASQNVDSQITSQNARLFGQTGAILVTGNGEVSNLISGKVFVAIQFLEDTQFDSGAGGLTADTTMPNKFPDDTAVSSDVSANGAAIDSVTFPKGMTLYGRYSGFKLSSGKVIAYLG